MDFKTGSQKGEPFITVYRVVILIQNRFHIQYFTPDFCFLQSLFLPLRINIYISGIRETLLSRATYILSHFIQLSEGVAHGHCSGLGFELSQ